MKGYCFLALLCLLAVFADAKLLGRRAAHPRTWTKGDAAEPHETVSFMIALKQQNLKELERLFYAVSDPDSLEYQNFMTIEEIDRLVAPKDEHVAAVVAWLRKAGATDIKLHNDYLEVTTTVKTAELLFSTKFFSFLHKESGNRIVRQWGEYSVPKTVEDAVVLVLGLSEFPASHIFAKKKRQGQDAVVPQTIYSMYGVPGDSSVTRKGSQGVIEWEGQSFDPSQLADFAQQMAIKIVPPSSNHIIGPNDPSNPQIEATLDIQYIAAAGLGVQNWFWLEAGDSWLYGFAKHFYGTSTVPNVISVSYGWNEEDQCEDGIGGDECQQLGVDSVGYVKIVNTEFQKIALRGISILIASGDSGANGRTDPDCSEDHLNPVFPAASPFVTSVGATEVYNQQYNLKKPPPACSDWQCISGGNERCVSYDQSNFASGGGFSNVAAIPSWQKDSVSAYFRSGVPLPPKGYYNTTGRGFPDVAAFGSAVLIDSGGLEPVGGTSCSAPIFAGTVSVLNDFWIQKTGKPLGFLNPLLYKMAKEHPAAFNDIVVGDNKCTEDGCSSSCQGFEATKGWDPVSGLGTPIYPEMLKYLTSLALRRDMAKSQNSVLSSQL